MPKQLFLDPVQAWELPAETDLDDLRERLRRALEAGTGVVEVTVVVDDVQAELLVNAAAVPAVLVVHVPGPGGRRIAH